MTQEQRRLIKRLGAATVVDVRTPNGESDFSFTLKTKGYSDYQMLAKKASKYIRGNYAGVIDYDQIPEILAKVM